MLIREKGENVSVAESRCAASAAESGKARLQQKAAKRVCSRKRQSASAAESGKARLQQKAA
ncbi:MAG: hypothetical protein J6R82_02790, partial [Clostridia bacterium]|nr:hypothetical protein [Clostridia bacterium]